VSRLPEDKLARLKARTEANVTERRARRVAGSSRRTRVAASKPGGGSTVVTDESASAEVSTVFDTDVVEPAELQAEENEAAAVEAETTETAVVEVEAVPAAAGDEIPVEDAAPAASEEEKSE